MRILKLTKKEHDVGQYHIPVNLTKREFIAPHKLGCGLKQWEQLANHPSTGSALQVLLFSSNGRGGGDLDIDTNWHGPERTDMSGPGPMPDAYPEIAKRTIGRWAGDEIAIIGDYSEDSDLDAKHIASKIYGLCVDQKYLERYPEDYANIDPKDMFTDVTEDICWVIEHELCGRFIGDDWRTWKTKDQLDKEEAA